MALHWDKLRKHTVLEASNVAFGLKGFDEVSGTETAPTLGWFAFKAINGNCTLSATSAVGDNLTSVVIQNGDIIYGNFSAVAVTSGEALAYRN